MIEINLDDRDILTYSYVGALLVDAYEALVGYNKV